jgi:GNAT superfamily N-acetyltransferase
MECKSLAEVELRDATYPLNRSVPSNFLPALRTAAQLRELVALSVIDPSLSKVIVLSGKVVGCCLVERASDGATLSALGIEPLAQQRGGGRVLLDAVTTAARAAKLHWLSIESSAADASQQALLLSAGFAVQGSRCRMALTQPPNRSLLPSNGDGDGFSDSATTEARVTTGTIDAALTFLSSQSDWQPAPSASPSVLRKLASRSDGVFLGRSLGAASGAGHRQRAQADRHAGGTNGCDGGTRGVCGRLSRRGVCRLTSG